MKKMDTHAVCRAFIHTDRLHRKTVERAASAFGIHRSQHFVLMNIARMGEDARQKALAEKLEISPAALAVTLGKLEKGGYVEKRVSENDSRVNILRLTERGREIHRLSREKFDEIDRAMLQGFSDEEIACFVSFLTRMQSNLLSYADGGKEKSDK